VGKLPSCVPPQCLSRPNDPHRPCSSPLHPKTSSTSDRLCTSPHARWSTFHHCSPAAWPFAAAASPAARLFAAAGASPALSSEAAGPPVWRSKVLSYLEGRSVESTLLMLRLKATGLYLPHCTTAAPGCRDSRRRGHSGTGNCKCGLRTVSSRQGAQRPVHLNNPPLPLTVDRLPTALAPAAPLRNAAIHRKHCRSSRVSDGTPKILFQDLLSLPHN
jgi:hypothetical protein